jgi:hypothetical protein
MKRVAFSLVAIAAVASGLGRMANVSRSAGAEATQVYVTKIPPGYRDWRLISVAHEEGSLHSFAAILGNDVAIVMISLFCALY